MEGAEVEAHAEGKTLLVLDTVTGDNAERRRLSGALKPIIGNRLEIPFGGAGKPVIQYHRVFARPVGFLIAVATSSLAKFLKPSASWSSYRPASMSRMPCSTPA